MLKKTKHHGKEHICWYLLQCFSSSENHWKSVLIAEEGEYANFQNFERLVKAWFIYGDFQYFFMPSTDNINFGPNTKNYQDIFFQLHVLMIDIAKTYFGEYIIDKFLNDTIN